MVTCLLWSALLFIRSDATPMFRASDNIPYMTPYSSGYPTLKEKRKRNKSSLLSPHVAVPTTNYVRNARHSVFRREYIFCYPVPHF
ncbi:hypothetical protein EDD16DRAFT_1560580 [Pisolithus croceorrhizus]|nr:hypothetical protein EDD16DRAFT_1560580 [Pisolithus croceorrhizus]